MVNFVDSKSTDQTRSCMASLYICFSCIKTYMHSYMKPLSYDLKSDQKIAS